MWMEKLSDWEFSKAFDTIILFDHVILLKKLNLMDSMLSLLSLSNHIYVNGCNLCFIMVVSLNI